MKIPVIIRQLMLSVGFTVTLIIFRIFYSGSIKYLFFIWNLFLAAIPFGISIILNKTNKKYIQWILFAAWLIFFPNALYIITDLVHLKEHLPVPIWFDTILFFSAIINALMIAYASLQEIEFFLGSKFSNRITAIILFSCLFLSSYGVYIGRYLRWNSWDIITNPFKLLFEIISQIINPAANPRAWGMTIVLTAFFTIFYFTIKKFPIRENYR